jgi:hypothetical protein
MVQLHTGADSRVTNDGDLGPLLAAKVSRVAKAAGDVLENGDLGVGLGDVVTIDGAIRLTGTETVDAEGAVALLVGLVHVAVVALADALAAEVPVPTGIKIFSWLRTLYAGSTRVRTSHRSRCRG